MEYMPDLDQNISRPPTPIDELLKEMPRTTVGKINRKYPERSPEQIANDRLEAHIRNQMLPQRSFEPVFAYMVEGPRIAL